VRQLRFVFLESGAAGCGRLCRNAWVTDPAAPPSIRAEAGKRCLPAPFAPPSDRGSAAPVHPSYRGQTLLTARIVAHATQRGLVSRAPGKRRITSTASPPRLCHCFLRVWLSVQRPSSHGNSRRPGL